MAGWHSVALTTIRVPRGSAPPTDQDVLAALDRDRGFLHVTPGTGTGGTAVAGPYQILVDGAEVDEYVVWER